MSETFKLAAKGDLAAQRLLIRQYIALGLDGRCSKRSAYEHALHIARLAMANGDECEDHEIFLDTLILCIQEADSRGDDATRLSYAGELIGQIDGLIDAGDEAAGVWLASALPNIDPKVLKIARELRLIWAENVRAGEIS